MLATSRFVSHTKLGFIPELKQYLLRDNGTGHLELWMPGQRLGTRTILFDDCVLEFVRPVQRAYRVPDDEFNREQFPDDIGRIYVDQAPYKASVVEIK